jgi:Gluconate 2-dehydrogenase subunit 3
MPPSEMNRRAFVWSAAKVTAILALAGCLGEENHPEEPPKPLEQPPLDRSTLAAVCDRLLPGKPGVLPRASEVGVPDFVAHELDAPMFKKVKPFVGIGLAQLADLAQKEKGKTFHLLSDAEKDDLLGRFQADEPTIPDFSTARWFELVLTFALEGWLGPPSHGANKDGKTWDALGIQWPRGPM